MPARNESIATLVRMSLRDVSDQALALSESGLPFVGAAPRGDRFSVQGLLYRRKGAPPTIRF